MRRNATFLCLIGGAALITALFVVPYFNDVGRLWLAIPMFVFFVIVAVYGCHNPMPQRRKKTSTRTE